MLEEFQDKAQGRFIQGQIKLATISDKTTKTKNVTNL